MRIRGRLARQAGSGRCGGPSGRAPRRPRQPRPPRPRARESARSRGASAQRRAPELSRALGGRSRPSTLGGRPCPPRPGRTALPSAALRRRARRGRGRAGEAGPGRRAAAGMRGWRRNLAFCLQRLPDEGRTRPPPRPVSTGAARGEEGGPSAGLIGGRPLGVPAGGEGRTAVCFPGAGGKRLKRRARRVTAGHAAWSAAGPGGHSGRLHRARGGGTGARATAWGWGSGAKGSGRPRAQPATGARVWSLERPGPAQRPRASPRVGPGWGGPVCARSPRLGPGDPEAAVAGTQLSSARPAAAPRRPQSLQFLKVAERPEGRREGVRGERGAGRALPQRSGAAASAGRPPGLPRSLPVAGAAGRAGWRLRRTRARVWPPPREVRLR